MLDLVMRLEETVPAQEAQGSLAMLVISFGFVILVFLMMYLPQRKKEKQLKEQISQLNVGDKVITIGGFIGFVANIKEDEVTISSSVANTLVTFQKAAISTIIKREDLNKKPETTDNKPEKKSKKEDKAKESKSETEE